MIAPPELQDWRFNVDFEGIAWAIFDRQGESMNSLGRRPTASLHPNAAARNGGASPTE